MEVFLRKKQLAKGKRTLYLDFYPPLAHPETGKPTRRKFLKLEIYEKPKGEIERNYNKETRLLAETIRAQTQLDLNAGNVDPYQKSLPSGWGFDPGRDYLSPLPSNELTINPNLDQNPGWQQ